MTSASRASADEVRIDSGVIEGRPADAHGVRAFLGIPFAAPPVGELRWKSPQPVAPWEGVRKAVEFGPRPMQAHIYDDMVFRDDGPSEDCLYLNVWTPAASAGEKLPVMVWIFGGGYQAGGTSEPRQDGAHLATRGVIVVSMNYRLGIFGFFSHPALSAESGHGSGNYGLMDQTAALRWVRDNIAAFGGDPANVTLFGESAGSYSVSVQMATPTARGLFARAIGESGSLVGTRRYPAHVRSLADAEKEGTDFARSVGASSLAGLRSVDGAKLLEASRKGAKFHWGVVVDGEVLPEDVHSIYASGRQARVPLLAGWNADESRVYAVFGDKRPTAASFMGEVRAKYGAIAGDVLRLYPAATDEEAVRSAGDLEGDRFIISSTWTWVQYQEKTGVPVYRYLFSRHIPIPDGTMINGSLATSDDTGAPHAGEIPYVFHNLAANPAIQWQPADWDLSDAIETYWTNFARTGNPNGKGVPEWPRYTEKDGYPVLHLDTVIRAMPEEHRARHAFWNDGPDASAAHRSSDD
ncbi:MAG TPA: carboxylesterase family protein [Opitutaceae bacterium]|jgi:para-nitrobenzyl esterase